MLEENEHETDPALKKDEKQMQEFLESMLEKERQKVSDEARTKQELLENEKQMHLQLQQSQKLNQQEIEKINEDILDLKEQLSKVKKAF